AGAGQPGGLGAAAEPAGADDVRAAGPLPLPGRQQPGEQRRPQLGPGAGTAHARTGAGGLLPVPRAVLAAQHARQPRRDDQVSEAGAREMLSGETTIRVRYAETDRMGLLHHANYLVYFEQARVELLRSRGLTYREMEDQGFLLVLTKFEIRYRRPAYFDDLLR